MLETLGYSLIFSFAFICVKPLKMPFPCPSKLGHAHALGYPQEVEFFVTWRDREMASQNKVTFEMSLPT